MAPDDEFSSELRSTIRRSGLSLAEISQRLRGRGRPVSPASLSYWQSGRSRPAGATSLGALAALEEVLGTPPDALLNLVQSPRPRGRAMRHAEISEFIPESAPIRDALAELGFASTESAPHERFIHERLVVDSRRSVQVATFRLMVRALRDGSCGVPTVHQLAPDEPNIAPLVTPLDGCHLGQSLAWPDRRTYGSQVVVDGYLEAGQQAVIAYQVEFRTPSQQMTEVVYAVPRRAHDLMIEAEFRGPVVPVACEKFRRTSDGESSGSVRRDLAERIQVAESNFGPGLLGLRWQWPEVSKR